MKISIIIPIYNAEKYLDECITSVCQQTYNNLEIILVDDGSKDKSLGICNRWALKDKRIKVIHKENKGVSAARNSGLEVTTGEFVTFLDADDYLELSIIEKCVDYIQCNRDALYLYKFGYSKIEREKIVSGPELYCNGITQTELLAYAIYPNNRKYKLGNCFRCVWGTLFDASIVQNEKIRFPEELYIGEDAIFLMQYFKFVQSARIISNTGYYYRMVETSAVHRYKNDLYEQSVRQQKLIMQIIKQCNLENDINIKQSNILFNWWIFNILSKNGKVGYKQRSIDRKDSIKDAKKWYVGHKNEMKFAIVNSASMSKRTKLQYYMSYFLPVKTLCWIANIWKVQ